MKKVPEIKIPIINQETLNILEEAKKMQKDGNIDLESKEALKAIDLASKVINTIMSGNQIDPVFFQKIKEVQEQRISNINNSQKQEPKRVKKKKKFKYKKT